MDPRSFFREFLHRSSRTSDAPAAWADRPVADTEVIARYLLSSGHFVRSGRVKPRAFEPMMDKGRRRLETSVFRTTDLTEIENWTLAEREVGVPRGMPVLAR